MIYAVSIDATALSTAHRPRASVTARGKLHLRKADAYARWLGVVRAQVRRPAGWPLDALYAVTIVLHAGDRRARDCDNVCKGILDALQGTEEARHALWANDSQVRVCEVVIGAPVATPRLALIARVVDADWIAEHAAEVMAHE